MKFLPAKSGWGSARSEDVKIEAFSGRNEKYDKVAIGSWTRNLSIDSQIIWSVSSLVDEPEVHCGFTTFAAQLNEITEVEKDKLPPTDSRLRPDLRYRESGNLAMAEQYKVQVEEAQRFRRSQLESAGVSHEPQFFQKVTGPRKWVLKDGDQGYWKARQKRFQGLELINLFA